jgi:hypothetical protein
VATYGQQLIVFHRLVGQLWIAVNRCEHQFGWGGRIRTSAWGNQNPLPYHLATPQSCLESGGTGLAAHSFWQRRSIEGLEPFQQAQIPNSA